MRKPRLSYSNGVSSTEEKQSAVGKHWENLGEEEDFPAPPRQDGRGRPGAPAHGRGIRPGSGAGTGEGTPAAVGVCGVAFGGSLK